MPKKLPKADKAYKNSAFLLSPGARSLRILSEFVEPLERFRRLGIKDTIVFFGSARIKSLKESKESYKKISAKYIQSNRITSSGRRKIDEARIALTMSRYYTDAVELARMLTQWSKKRFQMNRFVVCSGGGPGIMEAANRGAHMAGGRSIGLNISLPFEQFANPFVSPELNFEFHYFFMRKFWFVYLAKALIMFPGGFGTLDELMEVLTLIQTHKVKKPITVLLYGSDYWKRVIDVDYMVKLGMIGASDLNLFAYADSPKEAYQYLIESLEKNYPLGISGKK